MTGKSDRQRDVDNTYELHSVGFGPFGGRGWPMSSRYFYRCSECGYLMQGGEWDEDCTCGNLQREPGRFGARTGDESIEVFEARNRRTGEFA